MEKMFLTNGGNLLRTFETALIGAERFYFQKPDGEFIREVSDSEAEYLCQNCLEIDVHFPNPHPEFLPTWHFIKSVRVLDNYSSFKAETSNNGGDYSFQTYHDWYVAQYPNGEWKFAFVENYSTSAEFSYDELAGSFQSDLGYLCLSNVVSDMGQYRSQAGIEWKDGEKLYGVEEVLEKIATMSSFEDMWNEQYEYIPSEWDEEEEGYTSMALSFSDKKAIITRLKELGVTKKDFKPSLRGQRRGGGRR